MCTSRQALSRAVAAAAAHCGAPQVLDEERAEVMCERQALEEMRQQFEAELQAARQEVAKAQHAVEGEAPARPPACPSRA